MSALASVTLWRVAVTSPVLPAEQEQHDERAKIVAEIAERLEELDALKREGAADLICQLAGIAHTSRRAFRITVQLLHGNVSEVLSSYQDQADKRGVTKQDVHYEFTQEVAKLARHYPELHRCIVAMRAQALQHEDPMSRLEVATPCAGSSDQ